jgi:hypothetical protein
MRRDAGGVIELPAEFASLGYFQTLAFSFAWSGCPPTAEIRPTYRRVCFVPILLQKSVEED